MSKCNWEECVILDSNIPCDDCEYGETCVARCDKNCGECRYYEEDETNDLKSELQH